MWGSGILWCSGYSSLKQALNLGLMDMVFTRFSAPTLDVILDLTCFPALCQRIKLPSLSLTAADIKHWCPSTWRKRVRYLRGYRRNGTGYTIGGDCCSLSQAIRSLNQCPQATGFHDLPPWITMFLIQRGEGGYGLGAIFAMAAILLPQAAPLGFWNQDSSW